MAWKAYLDAVLPTPTVTDSFTVSVKFEDLASNPVRQMFKTYKIMAGATSQQAKAPILDDLQRIKDMDTLFATLNGAIGSEIT